ncbi:fungal-specific transcription factor domain-containing protein [Dioszegia hungarica]|uniref:Fungal-specific transcription factor domain-containing protein n=1 Tax=Dioszegia hungarica TaxID=4972 RepID=A0AA38H5P8_9TREE|nr:fungal-specific transcription factor domain-containing protein [Dioszegia hungarica]KAI9634952.1 fungal-specific transcription factor domain-containing protein [Dioszegia hungarica]
MLSSDTNPFSLPTPSSGFLDPSQLHTGSSNSTNNNLLTSAPADLFDPLSTNWPYFSHIFGWGLDSDIDADLGIQPNMFENSESGPISSTENLSAAWLLSITPRGGSPTGEGKEQEEMKRDPFGRNHDNPWPNIFKPKMPDRPLTLGGVKASPRTDRIRGHPSAIEATSRNAMLSLVYLSHQAMWLMPDIEDFPDQETLSDFVDLYFEQFHATFPILHRPTFSVDNTSAVLLLAVAAVGATYADREFRPLAVALSELVRRIVQWMRASDQRSKFDRNLLVSYMLQSLVGVACGSREMMLHAEISRCSLVTSLRRLHLLRPGRSASDDLLSKGGQPSIHDKWLAWVEDESRRRFGWGVYLLDAQMAALLGIPAIASVNEAGVQLPCDDRLWDAPDAASWWTAMQEVQASGVNHDLPFLTVFRGIFTGQSEVIGTSDFGRSIVSHSMYSKPYLALQTLAKDTNPQSDPSHLRLSAAALYHHSRIAFSFPGLLNHVKVASGKYEPDISKAEAKAWLERWVMDLKDVRRAVWHAGVLNALLAEFPLGAFPEAFWAFDCALVLWAIVKYDGDRLRATGPRPALFAANWFDVEPPPMWIDHGGQLILPFLGSSTGFTVHNILGHFIDQLRQMPWGMAGMYKQVLEKLVEQEGALVA